MRRKFDNNSSKSRCSLGNIIKDIITRWKAAGVRPKYEISIVSMNGTNGQLWRDKLVNTMIRRQDDADRHFSVSVVVSFIPEHLY